MKSIHSSRPISFLAGDVNNELASGKVWSSKEIRLFLSIETFKECDKLFKGLWIVKHIEWGITISPNGRRTAAVDLPLETSLPTAFISGSLPQKEFLCKGDQSIHSIDSIC